MADEEIDRIFKSAIENHSDFECRTEDQITRLPSPPKSLTGNEYVETSAVDDSVDWEYKLPAPPTFRDETKSPSVTEFGTITLGNLSDMLCSDSQKPAFSVKTIDDCGKQSMKCSDVVGSETLSNATETDKIANNHEINLKLINNSTDNCTVEKQRKIQNEESVKKCIKQNLVDDLTNALNQIKPNRNENYEEIRQSSQVLSSNSSLDNFTITTYKDTKPVEVFEDDSIKSSVGEKRDKSKDDAVFRAPKPRFKEPNLSRTSSFSLENKMGGPMIKRSVSYVSLLAANMPRHSQPYRAHLTEQHSDAQWPKLRKTTSELNIDIKGQ